MKQGLALKLFEERENRPLIENPSKYSKQKKWPFLESLYNKQFLPSIDYYLTLQLLENLPGIPESVACLICHLSLASRQGHLCIRIHDNEVEPKPIEIWARPEDKDSLPHDIMVQIEASICEGSKCLPPSLMTSISLSSEKPATPLCKYNNSFYFQKFWIYETLFLHYFQQFQNSKPTLSFDKVAIAKNVNLLEKEKKLLPEQAEAVMKACEHSLTIICGGPGTGKTYTAAYIIQTIWQGLTSEQKKQFEILLAAPTGKAAAQLQKSLTKVLDSLEGIASLTTKTLHALLGVTKQNKNPDKNSSFLSADLILVDECSMIDIKLMIELLKSLKPGARLILLGDPFQLPPIETGSMFSDIIKTLNQTDSDLKPLFLKTCLRAELKGILNLAESVKRGDVFDRMEMAEISHSFPGVFYFPLEGLETDKRVKWIINEAHHFYSSYEKKTPDELIAMFNCFRILSPLRRGPFGVDNLNKLIYENNLQKFKGEKEFITPIMIVNNHKGLNLFNGETGILITKKNSIDPYSFQQGDYAIFIENANSTNRIIPAVLLPRFELAYCLSIHKSQGSEFDHVLLILPEGSEIFGREAFYTAITRAKKQLDILSDKIILQKTVSRDSLRLSGVSERYKKNCKGK